MKQIGIVALLALFSWITQTNNDFSELLERPETEYFKKFDLFEDSNILLTLTKIDTTQQQWENPTLTVNLLRNGSEGIDTLVNDTIFSRNPQTVSPEIFVEFIDYNFDGVKDLVIPYASDPRGNHGYHLYLVDTLSNNLHYVESFYEIGNPEPDSSFKVISSFVLAGLPFCDFYRINQSHGIVNLDHRLNFHDDMNSNMDSLILVEKMIIKAESGE